MIKAAYETTTYSFIGILKIHRDSGEQSDLSNEEADSILRPLFDALKIKQRNMVQPDKFPLSFKRSEPTYGESIPPLPDKIIYDDSPVRPNNKDFKRRSAAGEIVLSDYKKWGAIISYANGPVEDHRVKGYETYYGLNEWSYSLSLPRSGSFVLVGDIWIMARVDTIVDYVYYKDEQNPYDLGWVDPTPEELNNFITTNDVLSGEVTSTLADHNDRTVDVLTSMAEMPETVEMIYNAIKTCLRMYIDARKKAFRLQNQVAVWKNAKTSDRTRRQIIRNITETNAAIADVWLTYRYGIMPNVYLIEDCLEALDAPETLFLRDRSRYVDKVAFHEVLDWTSEKVDLTHRVMIKSRLKEGSTKVDSQLSASLTKTAWELIPLSFVIDWFVNVGDVLSASWPTASAEQGATYSWKADFTSHYTHVDSSATVTIRYIGYRRMVIDPLQFCKLEWDPYIDTFRKMDAMSLAWKIFLESVFKKLS